MRLFEVAGNELEQDLVLLFRNQIQRANAEGSPAELSYQAITNLMKSSGHGDFDYGVFKVMYDSSPEIQSIVQNFNQDGVVLNTQMQKDADGSVDDVDSSPTNNIEKMAKRATKRRS
jgi:hypothetical protein